MFLREIGGGTAWFVVGDQVDFTLPPQMDVFGAVLRDTGEAHACKNRFQNTLFGGSEFDEFKAIKAQRVIEQIGHKKTGFRQN